MEELPKEQETRAATQRRLHELRASREEKRRSEHARRRRARLRTGSWLGGAALAVVGVLVAGILLSDPGDGRIPPRVEVGGIEVGGLAVAEARAKVEAAVARRVRVPIPLTHPDGTLQTSPAELGASAPVEKAIARAHESRGRMSTLAARLGLGDTVQVPLPLEPKPKRVEAVAERLAKQIDRPPEAARVAKRAGQLVAVESVGGRRLDRDATAQLLRGLPREAELPVQRIDPRTATPDAETAVARAEEILDAPPAVVHRDRRLQLRRDVLLAALGFPQRKKQGTIDVIVRPKRLEPALRKAFGSFEREPVNASFQLAAGQVTVVPGGDGLAIDPERIARAIMAGEGTEIPLRLAVDEPDLTTDEARAFRIEEPVSEFTTEYACCLPRVSNIQRAAQILNGTVIPPGGGFSLNEALRERTRARGFVGAPAIYDGRLREEVGGGISQVATTTYNAAFFAGLELLIHVPHQFYISRYPMGREATVSWGGPELIFTNDWEAGILVQAIATDTSITIRLYSAKLGRRVETETGEPYDYVEAQTIRVPNPDLEPGAEEVVQSGGVRGFSVDYTREVYRGDERIRDEEFHVEYDPENTIVEYGPTA